MSLPEPTSGTPAVPGDRRLRSLDALRGFDMFWIVGGNAVFAAWAGANDWKVLDWIAGQLHHAEWDGFTFWDLIFPLFLFIAGVAMPFSLTRRVDAGADRAALRRHVVRRGLTLVLLGMVYNGLFELDFAQQRYPSVLGRIGLAYLGAGLIVLHTQARGQVLWIVGLLLGYWAALAWIPVPGFGAGDLRPGHTLTDWIDRQLIPGRLHREVRDPEGLLATLPAVGTALLGVLSGHWLRRPEPSGTRKALVLFIAGALCLGLGALWERLLPLNKNLWSSSFVLWTGGWSLLLLASFYLVIDVWGWRRWSFFFVVIGMNAITIYMLAAFVDFQGVAEVLFAPARERLHPALFAGGGLALAWALLYWMYRRRLFLRI